jgi:alkanesulfonate monooxygenase SsuD/methylene tetrahydromethanopterin reductase-like flavin-dependent oxidoreductase (luciferase family)
MPDDGHSYNKEPTTRKVIVMTPDDTFDEPTETPRPDRNTLDLGVFLPTMSRPSERPGDVAAAARHAEDLGFESVWVVDQLIAGTGAPVLDSGIALAAAASVTSRIALAYGVMIVPLRPVAWTAKQVASLQHVSGDRVILGVGLGGDRHDRSWDAAGVPQRERGRRLDAALRMLPDLLRGESVAVGGVDGGTGPEIRLAPPSRVPPIVVGGMSEPAMARTLDNGAGWFLLPVAPPLVAEARDRMAELAVSRRRAMPAMTGSVMAAMDGDPDLPSRDEIARQLSDVDGVYGIPPDDVDSMLLAGSPTDVASRLDALAQIGVERVVVTLAAGNWHRQLELLAEAHSKVPPRRATAGRA